MDLKELEPLILANHILHYQKVLDAYGHISMRHPTDPEVFIMSNDLPPALVSSPSDLVQYHVSNALPLDPNAKKGYQERFIHSEIYKKYPGVMSVVHSHSENVLPYTMSGVAMKPAFHIAGFLGPHVPIWDIMPLYQTNDAQDMLANTQAFGASLASSFSSSPSPSPSPSASISNPNLPTNNVTLMSNHGFTVVGTSIKEVVYRAIYTHINASVQTQALLLRSAAMNLGSAASHVNASENQSREIGGMRYLDTEEAKEGCMGMNERSMDRPWRLWVREVEGCGLYRMEGQDRK